MKIAPSGIRKAFRRGVRFARRGGAYRRGFRDVVDRAAAEVKPIVREALDKAREHIGEMCQKAYAAGRAEAVNALTPEALKCAGERALELADLENEARGARKH